MESAHGRGRRARVGLEPIALGLPALALGLALSVPILAAAWLAFGPGSEGWRAIVDPPSWRSIGLSLGFALLGASLQIAGGLAIALLLAPNGRLNDMLAVALLAPCAMSPSFAAPLLHSAARDAFAWAGEPGATALATLALDTWLHTPFVAIVLLAGLRSTSRWPLEAAALDGASRFRRFRAIVLPGLAPYILTAALFRAIDGFRQFDLIRALLDADGFELANAARDAHHALIRSADPARAAAIAVAAFVVAFALAALFAGSWRRARGRAGEEA